MCNKLYEVEFWYSPSNNIKDIKVGKETIEAENNIEASKQFYLKHLDKETKDKQKIVTTIKSIKRILYYLDINHLEKE